MTNRILFICNDFAYFNLHWRPRAMATHNAGYEVHVATPDGTEGQDLLGLEFHIYPLERGSLNPLSAVKSILGVRSMIDKVKPDLIHTITVKPNIYAGLVTMFAEKPPSVMSITGLGYAFTGRGVVRWLLKVLILSSYRLVTKRLNTEILFENFDDLNLFKQAGIAEPRRLKRIPGAGVDMAIYAPTPESDSTPLVILASRMLWDKGVGEFIEAARMLRAKGVNARFALVGDTDSRNPTAVPATQLETWKNTGEVEWYGKRDDMPAVFSKAHVVCLPSYREGLPRALIEAAACGRAIVTTDTPGCREIVRHGENGLLVPVRDSKALANALRMLIENPALRAQMGHRGREIAIAEFSEERVIKETLSVYRELLKYKWTMDI